MLRPNTELLKNTVMQEIPRYVDVETGTLVGEDKKKEALRKAMKYKNLVALDPEDVIPNYGDNLIPDLIEGMGQPEEDDLPDVLKGYFNFPQA